MSDSDITHIPQADSADKIHIAGKALISAVPWIGGPAAEIFAAVITQPLSKRKDEWILSIATGLISLKEKVDGFSIESLSQDENFVTTVMHASQVAVRNHHKEKLKALRNAVLNAATTSSKEDNLNLMFIRYIDELTPHHFRVLKFFCDNEGELSHVKSYEELYTGSLKLGPEMENTPDEFKLFCTDLIARGMLRISQSVDDFPGIHQPNVIVEESDDASTSTLAVTSIGRAFLRLILEDK